MVGLFTIWRCSDAKIVAVISINKDKICIRSFMHRMKIDAIGYKEIMRKNDVMVFN